MNKAKISKNVTIGKIVLSLIAIGVIFVPVYAVQTIEARAITHALELEGLYVNGTVIDLIDYDNDTIEQIEEYYPIAESNYSSDMDSAILLNLVSDDVIIFRDRISYLGNGTYTITYNNSDEPTGVLEERYMYIPLNINATEFMSPDFIRIQSDCSSPPILFITKGNSVLEFQGASYIQEVAPDNYIFVNTIQTRSLISNFEDSQVFLIYNLYEEPDPISWSIKVQAETYTGADIFTWNDLTLYIVSIMLCDVLLIGAIVFASDPIDIKIDRDKKRR